MNTSAFKTCLTFLIIVLAILQAPISYFFTEGFYGVVFMVPYMIVGLSLSIWALVKVIRERTTRKRFHIYGLAAGAIIGIGQAPQNALIEYFDWSAMKSERERVVANIRSNYKDTVTNNNRGYYPIPNNKISLIPLSRGGIAKIIKRNGDTISVEFYIDRGFIDHYSAFLYTNDPDEKAAMDRSIKEGKYGFYKKLDKNWYSIHY